MVHNDMPWAWPVWTPGVPLAGFIKRSTIHCSTQNRKALNHEPCGFREECFMFFSNGKSMGAIDPRAWAIFDHRDMIRRIYVKLQITMLHTKYRNFGSCTFREEDFYMYFPFSPL